MSTKTRVGVVNVTSYAGIELARLLAGHPEVSLTSVTGRSSAGQRLSQVYPHLLRCDLTIQAELGPVDLAFLALPQGASLEVVAELMAQGVRVIDLSADFRLKKEDEYEKWYHGKHTQLAALQEAVYGLPELHRQEIRGARLVANPGCYSTCALLALAPLVAQGVARGDIIIDAKSGLSGAGRSLSLSSHFAEANEDIWAYALRGHRHMPEISQELSRLDPGLKLDVILVPHLVPMTRGILTTCYAEQASGVDISQPELVELYRGFYAAEPFVQVVDDPPHTKHTLGSNFCLIYPTIHPSGRRIIVASALDNLVKGAAGQAVQNMNLMLGIKESTGLDAPPIWP